MKKPLTPHGVEHQDSNGVPIDITGVKKPLTPHGVEHKSVPSGIMFVPACEETSDASRR